MTSYWTNVDGHGAGCANENGSLSSGMCLLLRWLANSLFVVITHAPRSYHYFLPFPHMASTPTTQRTTRAPRRGNQGPNPGTASQESQEQTVPSATTTNSSKSQSRQPL